MQGGRAISMESGPKESPGRPRDEGRLEEPPAAPTCRRRERDEHGEGVMILMREELAARRVVDVDGRLTRRVLQVAVGVQLTQRGQGRVGGARGVE